MLHNWFLNLRTGTKLGVAFSAALLIAVLVGVTGWGAIERLSTEADKVNQLTRQGLNSLVKFRTSADAVDLPAAFERTEDLERFAKQVKVLSDQAQVVLGRKDLITAIAQEDLATQGGGAKAGEADQEEKEKRERLGNISKSLSAFEEHVQALVALAALPKAGDPPRTVTLKDAQGAIKLPRDDAQKLEGDIEFLATTAKSRMDNAAEWGQRIMIGGAIVGALLAALVGIITTRMVVRPLNEMTAAAHRISEGDLTAEINHVSRDEVGGLADSFRRMQGSLRDLSAEAQRVAAGDLTRTVRGGGELGESFNRMVESLSALLREIQEAGTQVGGNSNKILGGLQRNAEASREESTAADRVQGSMEKLSESARGIAQSAADVERTAGDAARGATHGTAQVGAALEGLFRTRERVAEITQKTLVLGEKCRRIGEVLKIIRDVAGEIHMLALNAAIESAASAGEHGKRFTVVAGEVRRLAERTRQSAEEIRAILTEIQQAAEATVTAAQEGAKEVEAGSTVATGARAALEEVIGRIHQTAEVAREISRATQDQRQASEQVAGSMRDISRAVRRMAEGSEESTKAVRELTALAERFGDLMGTFRTS
jgi:methyl-accepting chemotaxis protein